MLLHILERSMPITITFTTRQFKAGNSQAVRLPADIAFPPKTELVVTREGEKIIIQPLEKTMEDIPLLFASLKKYVVGGVLARPEFIESERDWRKK
jgi:antitoxin VapB